MIVYFADRMLNILGVASTNLNRSYVIQDDLTKEDVGTGISTFDLTVGWSVGEQLDLQEIMEVGNYILKNDNNNKAKLYAIIEEEINTKSMTIEAYCEDAGLDFINEIAPAYEAGSANIAQFYINKYIGDSGYEIGIDELSTETTKKLSWDGESTVAERLKSIANSFDCEIEYTYEVEGMKLTHRYINILKKRGDQTHGTQLRLNLEIDKITTKKSIENLATAFYVQGGTPKGKDTPINLKGYAYDDGYYYVDSDSGYLISKSGQENWTRLMNSTFNTERPNALYGQIVKQYSYDTTDKGTLVSHAISELKKVDHIETNYEVEIPSLPANIGIGDRVNIVDDTGELYVSARILELETSVTQQSNKLTLGEYLIKTSGISAKIEELAEQWSSIAKNRVYYTWIAYADSSTGTNISLDPAGKTYLGTATNKTVEEVDITDPTAFTWVKVTGDGGIMLTVTSSNGTLFKNSQITTILTAYVYNGEKELSLTEIANLGTINWYKDNILVGTGSTYSITNSSVNPATYSAQLEVEE